MKRNAPGLFVECVNLFHHKHNFLHVYIIIDPLHILTSAYCWHDTMFYLDRIKMFVYISATLLNSMCPINIMHWSMLFYI